ncbi:unnamed protein product [Bursaphelenchus xylophilus]|uniref:(pine wood nematode) hypothetical protein n=1 Tax=Bursaphelenchus xylophilus TaxID=6326 RepID=A0A1I7RH91_BURXY|nr:unnamed protein product [Bursaphelenchus xylophilus]CAG9115924.1 unnamed protein product [Bursaphelenchus xylophilus]
MSRLLVFVCFCLIISPNEAFLKGVSQCSERQLISIKQCFFKYMEEVYEDINDVLLPTALKELLYRMTKENSECRKFWNLAMCFKFLDPCYDNIWDSLQRTKLNAAFSYKYSMCSGMDSKKALFAVKCLDNYERDHVCEKNMQMSKDMEVCTSQGHKIFKCLNSKTTRQLCGELDESEHTVVCQLYTFRRVIPCLQNNCALRYLEDNYEDSEEKEEL